MGRKVAIVGAGLSYTKAVRDDVSLPGLIKEAVQNCLDDAELEVKDIEAFVYGSSPEPFHGTNWPDLWLGDATGAYMKPFFRLAGSGIISAEAAFAGYYLVSSGMFDVVMVTCGEQLSPSEEGLQHGGRFSGDNTYYSPYFSGSLAMYAPHATAYLWKYGYTREQMSVVAVKDRKNALKNPYAHLKSKVTLEEVMKSPMLATPLTRLDCCPTSDGTGAMILACEEKAEKIARMPAWIKAAVISHHAWRLPAIDYADPPPALIEAAQRAYQIVGIKDPLKEIDVVEMYSPFSFFEPIMMEGLLFWPNGEALKHIVEGATSMHGEIPVNPSGGPMATNPVGPTSMIRIIEAAMQVMGKAGAHQIPGAKTALATGFGGYSQFHTVCIVSSTK